MSLVPLLFSDWWQDLQHPHSILDQHFGVPIDPEDFIEHIVPRTDMSHCRPNSMQHRLSRYHPFVQSLMRKNNRGLSTVSPDKDNFVVTLDVQQFSPEEINVKVVDNTIVVEAKHEEKQDEHGWISRQFVRKYLVPNQCDIEQVQSQLSSDGVLTIKAPKKEPVKTDTNEKVIKIQLIGAPAVTHQDSTGISKSQKDAEHQLLQHGKTPSIKAA